MNYGKALEALKQGKQIARSSWIEKNTYLFLNKGMHDFRNGIAMDGTIENIDNELFEEGSEGIVTRLPNIAMRTSSGTNLHGWTASQIDMLAEDWTILN